MATRRCITNAIIYLSLILQPSTGYDVFQPETRTVYPDGSAIISCEHNANVSSVIDARLSSVAAGRTRLLCQLLQTDCKDVVMYQRSTHKFLFILLEIRSAALSMRYQCQFTVELDRKHVTKTGDLITLLPHSPGQEEVESRPQPSPRSDEHRWTLLEFVLLGLLAPTLLYSCVVTWYHLRQRGRLNINNPENATYVEMRKAPPTRNHEGNSPYAEVKKQRTTRSA